MFRTITLASCLILTAPAWAETPRVVEVPAGSFYMAYGVNVRNGNYSTTFHTVTRDGMPAAIAFERVYNSRSTQQSDYGLGWSTAMDSRIEFDASGALVVHEHGVGAQTRYELPEGAPEAAKYRKSAMDAWAENSYQARRAAEVAGLVSAGKLAANEVTSRPPRQVPDVPENVRFRVGKTFIGDSCRGSSTIRREDDELIRQFLGSGCKVSSETYTLEGEFVSMESLGSAPASLKMARSKDDAVVTAITDEKGNVTRFKYDDKKRLLRQDSPDGAWQGFEYDGHDNMTAIIYLDGTRRVMSYDTDDRVISTTPPQRPEGELRIPEGSLRRHDFGDPRHGQGR